MNSAATIAIRKALIGTMNWTAAGKSATPADQPQRGAETGGCGNAQREGARQRIGENGLHLCAGDRKRGADRDRHQRDRHADIPDHDPQLSSTVSG